MYYRTPGNLNPILLREETTPTNIADNFDECTVINDDLNMNGYSSISVDAKHFSISANLPPKNTSKNSPKFFFYFH